MQLSAITNRLLSFTGQPIALRVDAPEYANTGAPGEYTFTIANNNTGTNIIFNCVLLGDIGFTHQPQPIVEDGLHLEANSDAYAIVAAIMNNYILNSYYTFTATNVSTIVVTTKINNPDLDLSISGSAVSGFTTVQGVSPDSTQNIRIAANINHNAIAIAELTANLNAANYTVFDASKIIQSKLKRTLFPIGAVTLEHYISAYTRWQYQVFAVENGIKQLGKTAEFISIIGNLHRSIDALTVADYYGMRSDESKFLTRQPREKNIRLDSLEPLCWYSGDYKPLPWVFAYYADGSFFYGQVHQAITTAITEMYYMENGIGIIPEFTGGNANTTAPLLRYVVGLLDEDGNINSELFMYNIVEDCGNASLIFSNCLGGWDTAHCNIIARSIETNASDYVQPFIVSGSTTQTSSAHYAHAQTETLKFHTGWYNATYIDYLADEISAAEEIYLIEGTQYLPVVWRTKKIEKQRKGQTLFGFVFECERSLTNEQHSSTILES